ncbi:cytochrome b [Pseudooceanicola nanhaiensis]|uniref:cytochrome b n=1 Tax=Pseudooceanicola nanhaiensis TaxID=375761 RepID=UPI001CD5DD16|nr:cytochrome b/b6 domain-containing protein [Pseudooceanicola nanhaiensis]MCA0922285.1 cytochrome b/b6 domain-containing protein [Pseudooceanicola nanhaiensis]
MSLRYSRAQILLHWIVVLLVAAQFLFEDGISTAWRQLLEGNDPGPSLGANAHVIAGIAVLVLAVLRILLRFTQGVPPLPKVEPRVLRLLAHVAHWALYALLILLPLTGGLAWFLGVAAAAEVHEALKTLLLLLIVLHVGAALYHQFILRDGLMSRMR